MTFLEGRDEGASVDDDGAREDVDGFDKPEGGPRKVEAAEGGGRREVVGFGGILNAGGAWLGREGGRMTFGAGCSSIDVAFGDLRTGGGIVALSESASDCAGAVGFIWEPVVWPPSCSFAVAFAMCSCSTP